MTQQPPPDQLATFPAQPEPPAVGLEQVRVRTWHPWQPENPDWIRGVAMLILLAAVLAMVFTGRDTSPGFAAVTGLAGMATAYFFKK